MSLNKAIKCLVFKLTLSTKDINLNIQKSALEADRDRYKEELEKVSKAYQQYVDSIRSRKAYKIVKFFRRGKKND